jgi:hypothetical protein
MKIETFEGIVQNGQIQLLAPVRLPEHAKVYVVVPGTGSERVPVIPSPRLVRPEDAALFVKEVIAEPRK